MLKLSVKNDALARLADAVERSGRKLPREVATAVNATARKTKSLIGKGVTKELAVTQKVVKPLIDQPRKAKHTSLVAVVRLKKSARLALKAFKPRQTKQGVSYKISKRRGRSTAPHAFIVDKVGGHVFRRTGKARLPITKLYGPSPWGVFVKRKMQRPTAGQSQAELMKQLERRIRFNNLKADGTI